MNLHEYQAKEILKSFNVKIPKGIVAFNADDAFEAATEIAKETGSEYFVVKAQIHAGGRGKGGGVRIAHSIDEVKTITIQMLGMKLITPQTTREGKLVSKVLIEQNIYYQGPHKPKEYYLSIMLNRAKGKVMIMYSSEGGMDIELVAEKTPHLIFMEEIDERVGLLDFQCRKIASNLGMTEEANKNMLSFIKNLYRAYVRTDASMIEVNPLFMASDEKIYAADCKMRLDDNALFRHKDYVKLRDFSEEDLSEVEAREFHLNYIKLTGNVGCMVNGAGLAMATMDIIKLSGGEPANFLDVGGTANAETVEKGFRIIIKDPEVKVILVNIFGGIVRCDRVAQGIIDAYTHIGNINIPVIVRLQGTNAEEARKLLEKSGLKVHSAILLNEAATLVTKLLLD